MMSKNIEQISLSKGLRLRIGDDGQIYGFISHSSGEFFIAPEILTLLCEIGRKKTPFDCKKLPHNLKTNYEALLKNLPDTNECEEILLDLIQAGVVVSKESISKSLQNDGFGDFWIQWAMLSDSVRTDAYEKAIFSSVNSKSVVVDLGAGSGLLTAMALKAGAKKVLSIEETEIANQIKPLCKQLKLSTDKETLTIHNQNSFDVELPKGVTHLVSELFGNDPFQEGVIPTLKNISKKLGKNTIYIPQNVQVFFEIIEILDHPIKHRIQSLQNHSQNSSQKMFADEFCAAAKKTFDLKNISFPMAFSANSFKRVSAPVNLGKLPLNPPLSYFGKQKHPLSGKKTIKLLQNGKSLAGLMWFRVEVSEGITLSSHPQEKDAAQHWSPILFLLSKSMQKGDDMTLEHRLNEQENAMECFIQ